MPAKKAKPADTPFGRFESLMKRLLKVPKKELDAKIAEEKAARKKRRKPS